MTTEKPKHSTPPEMELFWANIVIFFAFAPGRPRKPTWTGTHTLQAQRGATVSFQISNGTAPFALYGDNAETRWPPLEHIHLFSKKTARNTNV